MTTNRNFPHKTKFSVMNLKTGVRALFNTRQAAREFCLAREWLCLSIREPVYGEERTA